MNVPLRLACRQSRGRKWRIRMPNQPLVFYVLAVLIVKVNIAVICGFGTVVSEQHHPRRRVVVTERHTKDKDQARDMFSRFCPSFNSLVDLRNDLRQMLRDKPAEVVNGIKSEVQSVLSPLFLIFFEGLKLITINAPRHGSIREIQRNVSASLPETLNLFDGSGLGLAGGGTQTIAEDPNQEMSRIDNLSVRLMMLCGRSPAAGYECVSHRIA